MQVWSAKQQAAPAAAAPQRQSFGELLAGLDRVTGKYTSQQLLSDGEPGRAAPMSAEVEASNNSLLSSFMQLGGWALGLQC